MKKSLLMIVFSVSMLILLVPTNSYAGAPVSVQCGDMIGGTSGPIGGLGITTNPGAIILISQIDGSQTLIGSPTGVGSIPGLDFDGAGMLWGVNNIAITAGANPTSDLIKINPNTGALIDSDPITAEITDAPVSIQDLGVNPVTDVLFGTTHIADTGFGPNNLVTIDKATGDASLVGSLGTGNINSLDFAPDGTLYVTDSSTLSITTVNPGDASQLTTVVMSPAIPQLFAPALGVRGDGTIFISESSGPSASIIHTVINGDGFNPGDGSTTLIGDGVVDHIVDITFVECSTAAEIGGELLPIDSTALMLAGLQSSAVWMIPTLVGLAGTGFYLIKFRTTKE